MVKFFISELIPDTPAWVREKAAKKQYFKQLFLEDAIKKKRSVKKMQVKMNGETRTQDDKEESDDTPLVKLD